jgi:putative oxidoreductase
MANDTIQGEGMSSFTGLGQTCVIAGRVIFAAMFAMACVFKFIGLQDTAGYIAAAGFPAALALAALAAVFELALVIAFLTGAFFTEAALAATVYVVFLAFAFHGPSHWTDQTEFGAFISHFPFAAGLLFAAAHGPGDLLVFWRKSFLGPLT